MGWWRWREQRFKKQWVGNLNCGEGRSLKCDTHRGAERLSEQLEGLRQRHEWLWKGQRKGGGAAAHLVETVADAAQLRWELGGGADNCLEEALCDLPKVLLVLLQVLARFQPDETNKRHRVTRITWGIVAALHTVSVLYLCPTDGKMEARRRYHSPGRIHFEADVVGGDDDAPQQRLQ